ncbi:hypothetical protein [Streptomyces cylindrosporus]|uniref:Uncharacterized protein n=1 Tax=Streptomyces cylindrosporus TaxID=2927583 RepID=A0ABS9Y7T3_9ACTN|nr:hypothetical protein [Streptomyces cylindrosporus]MCI3273291.1 hypothetical protein [Streptomyces cylindrosporus]
MYEFEISQLRSAELIRRAEQERLAREASRTRRAARHEAEKESHTPRLRRLRSRTA